MLDVSLFRYIMIYIERDNERIIMPKEWSLFRKVLTVVFIIALPFIGSLDSF